MSQYYYINRWDIGSNSSSAYTYTDSNTRYTLKVSDQELREMDRYPMEKDPGHFRDTRPEAVIESPTEWLKRRVTEVCDEALSDVA